MQTVDLSDHTGEKGYTMRTRGIRNAVIGIAQKIRRQAIINYYLCKTFGTIFVLKYKLGLAKEGKDFYTCGEETEK